MRTAQWHWGASRTGPHKCSVFSTFVGILLATFGPESWLLLLLPAKASLAAHATTFSALTVVHLLASFWPLLLLESISILWEAALLHPLSSGTETALHALPLELATRLLHALPREVLLLHEALSTRVKPLSSITFRTRKPLSLHGTIIPWAGIGLAVGI